MKEEEPRKHCPSCKSHGVVTPVEIYRKRQLNYCTYHYWLMLAGPAGTKLGDYVRGSESHAFVTSLPSAKDMRLMEESPRHSHATP